MKAGDVRIEMPKQTWDEVLDLIRDTPAGHLDIGLTELAHGGGSAVMDQADLDSMAQIAPTNMRLPEWYWQAFIDVKLSCTDCGEAFRPSFGLLLERVEALFCQSKSTLPILEDAQSDLDSPLGAVLADTRCGECCGGKVHEGEKIDPSIDVHEGLRQIKNLEFAATHGNDNCRDGSPLMDAKTFIIEVSKVLKRVNY